MNLMSSEVLRKASQFSDWRIYPKDKHKSCALDDVVIADGVIDRRWVTFDQFDSDQKLFLEALIFACQSQEVWSSYSLEFYQIGVDNNAGPIGLRFRVQDVDNFYAISKLTSKAVDLSALQGVTQEVRNFILSSSLQRTGGLVIACGDARVGKSLFVSASMRERLVKYGGYCLVLSDPIEHFLGDDDSSLVGEKGKADYIDVSSIGYTKALPISLRSYPLGQRGSMIFGETRCDMNAFDLVNSANNGHLIFTTLHASSPDAAIDRLVSWCSRSNVAPEVVRNILASSLQGITFHSFSHGKFHISSYPANEETRKLIRVGHPLPFMSSRQIKV